MEKETVIIGDKQAPVTQKQKATDHIDEGLRLAIFKTLKLSQVLFSHSFVRISERGSKRHWKKSQSQLCWSIPDLFGLCWSVFDFYFSDALFSPCTVCDRVQ